MYYILNGTNQIIAADKDILEVCGVSHINDLYPLVISQQIKFNIVKNSLIITNNNEDKSFNISQIPLSSLLGSLTIISVTEEVTVESDNSVNVIVEDPIAKDIEDININKEVDNDDDLLNSLTLDDDIIEEDELDLDDIFENAEKEEDIIIEEKESSDDLELDLDNIFDAKDSKIEEPSKIEEDDLSLDMDELFAEPIEKEVEKLPEAEADDLSLDMDELFAEPEEKKIEKIPEPEVDDLSLDMDDLFAEPKEKTIEIVNEPKVGEVIEDDLGLDSILGELINTDEEILDPFDEEDDDDEEEDESEILIDITKASEDIGIDTDDYLNFLEEYIDTAINYEDDIRENTDEKEEAVDTLLNLSDVLHLYEIGEIIKLIDTVAPNKQSKAIDRFYASLSRISTFESGEKEESTPIEEPKTEHVEEIPEDKPVHKPTISEQTIPRVNSKSFGDISLEGIKPIHFDFRLEEAADDLSLPVDLIEEFVNDFIDQAKVETENMMKAYSEGNLDTIQKIGHLLKGTAANLRIKALADTLYKIQFCENPSDLEDFITDYWGHFLSFEIQIKAISH